jgi:uncharacterized UBP type Zn finger protein
MSEPPGRKRPTGDVFRKHLWSLGRKAGDCAHRDQIRDVARSSQGCDACLEMGDRWIHLRMCMTCGHVGCCNDSKNKHASKHFQATGHPIVKPLEEGQDWLWCYADEVMLPLA